MTRITPLIGSESAERSFLPRFGDLCADPLFHVRKVRNFLIWILNLKIFHFNLLSTVT